MRKGFGSSLPIETVLWRGAAGIVLILVVGGFLLHPYLSQAVWFGPFQQAAFGTIVALGVGKYVVKVSETPSLLLTESQIVDLPSLAKRLQEKAEPASRFLFPRLVDDTCRLLPLASAEQAAAEALRRSLARDLNHVLRSTNLSAQEAFASEGLRQEITAVTARLAVPIPKLALNRWLLERAYPKEIDRGRNPQADAEGGNEAGLFVYAEHLVSIRKVGAQQRRAALVMGAILGAILIVSSPSRGFAESAGWLLLPIILLGPCLYLRKYLKQIAAV